MSTYIATFSTVRDTRGEHKKDQFNSLLGKEKISSVRVVDLYTIDAKIAQKDVKKIGSVLTDDLVEGFSIHSLPDLKFSYLIEVGFLPGVTDNVATTTTETIEDTLGRSVSNESYVFTSQLFFISGALSSKEIKVITDSLHNPLIQRARVIDAKKYKKEGFSEIVPRVNLSPGNVDEVDLNVSDEELEEIGTRGIQNSDGTRRGPLGLSLDELKAIRTYFEGLGRNPADIELETFAQTWSEHCKHTIFANPIGDLEEGLYRGFIKRATKEIRKKKGKKDFCLSVFTDNSGVIEFDRDTVITHKVETHNSPSALDPFGGAITGIVGVNRDTIGTGLGAKPVINYYGYCFADPEDDTVLYRDEKKKQPLLSSRRIMEGVIEGVNSGGNQSGIPTPQGFMLFEKRFRGKPLVFVGTVGMMPKKINGKESYTKSARPGDLIVMVGGRVGVDGIHGATFSSVALDEGSPATAVQIGDPITQKKLSDAVIKEARDKGLYTSITDNGAGGLSSSVGEMAEESGGCRVDLDVVPLKYHGLSPWEIWISESQERMTLSVPKGKWKKLSDLFSSRGVEATVIGEFTDSGHCIVQYKDEVILDVEMEFLHDGLPVKYQKIKEPKRKLKDIPQKARKSAASDLNTILLEMTGRPNLASHAFVSRQYDHEVQGSSVTKPLQGKGQVNTYATVSRPKLSSEKGVVLSQALYPTYSDIDTYHMAACSIDTAVRNAVSVGADPDHLALLDNFCWCSSNEPERLYELKEAARACYDYACAFGTPYISGKDSMFNDFKGFTNDGPIKISIPPTLLVSSIGVIKDVTKAVTLDAKKEGDSVYLLGETKDELGASEYYAHLQEQLGKRYTGVNVPKVNARVNKVLYQRLHKAIQGNLIASSYSLSRGGLADALVKTAIGGQLGINVDLGSISSKLPADTILFSESQGRVLATIDPNNKTKFEKIFGKSAQRIGVVSSESKLSITRKKRELVNIAVSRLTESYRSRFKNF